MTGSQKFHLSLLTTLRLQNKRALNNTPSDIKKMAKIHVIHTLREDIFAEDILAEFIFRDFDPKSKINSAKISKHGSVAKTNSAKINKKTNSEKKKMYELLCLP